MSDPACAEFTLLHRMSFWGRSDVPGMRSWEYQGQTWRSRRPTDGDPPVAANVRCAVCFETLEFRVESAAATRRRRTVLRCAALVLALLVVLFAVACSIQVGIADDGTVADDVRSGASAVVALSTVGAMLSVASAWTLTLTASNTIGVRGNGAGAPWFTRHRVQRA